VQANSPAERAGLKRGDVIVRVNGAEAGDAFFLDLKEGETAELELQDGTMRNLTAGRYY
jgi:S1-C subfamily serine protease